MFPGIFFIHLCYSAVMYRTKPSISGMKTRLICSATFFSIFLYATSLTFCSLFECFLIYQHSKADFKRVSYRALLLFMEHRKKWLRVSTTEPYKILILGQVAQFNSSSIITQSRHQRLRRN